MVSPLYHNFYTRPSDKEEELRRHILGALRFAEELYGPRDECYVIKSVLINPAASSQVANPGQRELRIVINDGEAGKRGLIGILAHECIHCLNPVSKDQITVLEEGVAEDFCYRYSREFVMDQAQPPPSSHPSYVEARSLVQKLEGLRSDIIRTARVKVKPPRSLSNVTGNVLLKHCAGCPKALAAKLAAKFYDHAGDPIFRRSGGGAS